MKSRIFPSGLDMETALQNFPMSSILLHLQEMFEALRAGC